MQQVLTNNTFDRHCIVIDNKCPLYSSIPGGQDYDDSMHIILFHTELLNRTMTECTTIQTIDDHAIEGDETFEVNFVLLYPSYALVMNRSSAVVTILQSNKNCKHSNYTILT